MDLRFFLAWSEASFTTFEYTHFQTLEAGTTSAIFSERRHFWAEAVPVLGKATTRTRKVNNNVRKSDLNTPI
jgi:hypothetical protein